MIAQDRVRELEQFIDDLKRTHARVLREQESNTHAQEYRAAIAEWALIGVVRSRVQFRTTDSARGPDVLLAAEEMGRHAARALLHGAKIAFDDHAELDRLIRHIHYLEGHAKSRGLPFRPYEWRIDNDRPQWENWPKRERMPLEVTP